MLFDMEQQVKNLYMVWAKGWTSRCYVAAHCQQDAVELIAPMYDDIDMTKLNVEYVAEVYT